MKIFLICSVRSATPELLLAQQEYVSLLESAGHVVHYPPRDTPQDIPGLCICDENMRAIQDADEVHVFYNPDSQGIHFDMGIAFGLGKKVVVAHNVPWGPSKSFPRMLDEWACV